LDAYIGEGVRGLAVLSGWIESCGKALYAKAAMDTHNRMNTVEI
jgi:hypothetical protein